MGTFVEAIRRATDDSGWASYTGGVPTIYYVYPGGAGASDSNNGTSPNFVSGTNGPFATVDHAWAVVNTLANLTEVWILVAKGTSHQSSGIQPKISGPSSTNPIVFSSYDPGGITTVFNPKTGGSRPQIRFAAANGGAISTSGGAGGANGGNNIAVIGLHLYCSDRDVSNTTLSPVWSTTAGNSNSSTGFSWGNSFRWVYIEDNRIDFFQSNIAFDCLNGGSTNTFAGSGLRVRRNVILDAYSGTGGNFPQGASTICVTGVFEENLFDQNGFNNAAISAGITGAVKASTNHNFYWSQFHQYPDTTWGSSPTDTSSNIISNGASGNQSRSGYLYDDNFFSQESYAGNLDSFSAANRAVTDGGGARPGTWSNNVCVNGRDDSTAFAQGLTSVSYASTGTNNISGGVYTQRNNITANTTVAAGATGLEIFEINTSGTWPFSSVVIDGDIVFNWDTNASTNNIAYTAPVLQITNQKFDESGTNVTYSFPDPWRSEGSWYATLGLGAANSTFLGSISGWSAGRATLTIGTGGITGPALVPGDAVTFSGQPQSIIVISGSGTIAGSTYTVACGSSTSGLGTQSMSGWTRSQWINAARGQYRQNWNYNLTANAINNYIRAGFGMAAYPTHRGGNHLGKF